jgi:membrane associated rhomboid family serine protease
MARFGSRSGGILNFGDFRGFTRDLVLWNLGAYFLLALLGLASPRGYAAVFEGLALTPGLFLHGWLWQIFTYPLIHAGILNTAFELLSLWFLGSFLEANHGSRWLMEIFAVSALGAGIAAILMALGLHTPVTVIGCWGAIFGLLIAFGVLYADTEFMMFPLPMLIKAKYLVAVYVLIALAMLFSTDKVFAFSQLGGGVFGYLYIRFAPRRGITTAGSKQYFDWRNRYYRWKRKQAAKKFQVYMKKQNRDVNFDSEGRYVDPDKDQNDRGKWN